MSFSLQIPIYSCSKTSTQVTSKFLSPLIISAQRTYSDDGNIPSDQYVKTMEIFSLISMLKVSLTKRRESVHSVFSYAIMIAMVGTSRENVTEN